MTYARATDVVVVGGGPAGSAAAITLARLGRRVTVVDKATFPRDKCCGDGLTTAALRQLERLGLDPTRVDSWQPVAETVVMAADGLRVDLPFAPDGTMYAASARRRDLDAALVELAEHEGADVIQGHAVVGVTPLPTGGVAVDIDDGTRIASHFVIAADGAWSNVRRSLGLTEPGYLGDWRAGRQYFSNVGPEASKLWVWFEPDMAPGYAWSFPLPGNMANVGYGVVRQPGQPLGALKGQRIDFRTRPRIADVLGSGATPAGSWRAWPIPGRISTSRLEALDGRVLFSGDAARACDPMTGEGIAQALETAQLAARAIVEAGPHHSAQAAQRYTRQLRWGMAFDEILARALSNVLARPGGSARSMRMLEHSDWFKRQFVRWMFEDYPRAVLATPHRWRRDLLRRPGAYGLIHTRQWQPIENPAPTRLA